MLPEPQIVNLSPKKLLGKKLRTSLVENRSVALWQSFMPLQKNITNKVSPAFYSMQVYDEDFSLNNFTPATPFDKWAAVEVSDFDDIPAGLEAFSLPGGWYAVFIHKGDVTSFPATMQYIYSTWLPGLGFQLDNRPHFELLGEQYRRNDPLSEEEVWVPVKKIG